jgi:glycosyltransferase involved in cell wall biosynthesis
MQLYGDGLERLLLEKGWGVKRIEASKIFGYLACGSRSLQKWLGYLDKFILYPIVLQARMRGFDLIHVLDHSYSWLSFFIPFQKTLVTCHDLLAVRSALGEFLPYHETRFSGKILQKLILFGLRCSRSIVCVSHQTQVDLHRLVPESRRSSWVIENGMNRKLIVPSLSEARERLMDILPLEVAQGKIPYFFHIGGNVWYKNRISILQGFHQIIKQYPVKLILVGGEINHQEKELIHSLKLEDFIVFVGKINDRQLEALYKLAAALVFPLSGDYVESRAHEIYCWKRSGSCFS